MALGRRPFILFTFPCKLKQTSWRQEMNFQLVPIAEAAVFFLAVGYRKRLLSISQGLRPPTPASEDLKIEQV